MAEKSDVSQILEAMNPEDLALLLAAQIKSSGKPMTFSPSQLGNATPLVASVERDDTGELPYLTIRVREPQRESGYYLVYDPNYLKDVVAYWDDARGAWLASHLQNAASAGMSSGTRVVQKLDVRLP